MADLTVVILTKNEELNLEKCIYSFSDQAKRFVIVDSGSTDGTKQLCSRLRNKLSSKNIYLDFYEHDWLSHSDQFNWGLDNADIKTKWTMRMDSDEEVTPELLSFIRDDLSQLGDDVSGIVIRRRLIFLGKWIRHGGRYPEYLLRIFRTGKGRCENRMMDEHIIVKDGTVLTEKVDIIDRNQKSLTWWINKHNWYSGREMEDAISLGQGHLSNSMTDSMTSAQAKRKRMAKNLGYYHFPLFLRAHLYYIYRYYIRLGFLDGKEGKIFNFLQAYWYRFLVDAKIYENKKNLK